MKAVTSPEDDGKMTGANQIQLPEKKTISHITLREYHGGAFGRPKALFGEFNACNVTKCKYSRHQDIKIYCNRSKLGVK